MATTPPPFTPADVANLLAAAGAEIEAEVRALPADLATWRPAEGEWCVNEVLGHLIEAEKRGFAGRIRQILAENEPRLIGWDPPQVARDRHDCERPVADVLDEFLRMREDSVALTSGLTAADLARGGHHPQVGYLTVNDLIHEWVHHDRNHFRQLLANVQAAVYPNMGNSQKFVGE
jgi:hypothetical protein